MKRKIVLAVFVIATVCVIAVSQTMRTSDLEVAAVASTSIEPTNSIQPASILPATSTPVPSASPAVSSTPLATTSPVATSTPTATATPAPSPSVAPAKREGIITSDSSVNIRAKASTDSDIVGKLYTGAILTIESEKSGWCYVVSGKIKGYVSKDLITISDNIDSLKKKYQYSYASVSVKLLNARSKASTESDILAKLEKNSQHKVLSVKGDWVQIALYNTEMTGYVSKEFVAVKSKQLTAISAEADKETKQQLAEKLTELKEFKEEADAPSPTPAPEKTATPSKGSSSTKAPTATKTPAATPKPSTSASSALTNSRADQIKLLATIIYCEAGADSYEGKLAVANAILNRVKSSSYPNTIKGVVFQKNQFSPTTSGRLEIQLKKYSSYSTRQQLDCITAAKNALAGHNNIGNRMCFRSARTVSVEDKPNGLKIGAHVFW